MSLLSDLARAGFVLPAELSIVAARAPMGGDPAGGATSCADHGTVGHPSYRDGRDELGGGKSNAPGRAQERDGVNSAAQPRPWCSECEDERVWHPESDIGFACVERRLRAWGGER